MEGPRYVEAAPIEGAKPPVDFIPMQIPTEEFDPSLEQKSKAKSVRLHLRCLEINCNFRLDHSAWMVVLLNKMELAVLLSWRSSKSPLILN